MRTCVLCCVRVIAYVGAHAQENILDSLTLVVKALDIFVLLVKVLGVAMLVATAGLLIKLLPKKLQIVVKVVAATLLFVVLIGENALNMFVVSAIRQSIWVLSALGIFVILETAKLIASACRHKVQLATLIADLPSGGATGIDITPRREKAIGNQSPAVVPQSSKKAPLKSSSPCDAPNEDFI